MKKPIIILILINLAYCKPKQYYFLEDHSKIPTDTLKSVK